MGYQINSSINTIVINQAATSSATGDVEMIDVTYTNNNGVWTSTVPSGYTVATSYFINSDECVIYTTDNCDHSIITPGPGGGDDCLNPPCDDKEDPEPDPEYTGSTDPNLIFNYCDLGVRLLDYLSSDGYNRVFKDQDGGDYCGKSIGTTYDKDYIITGSLDILNGGSFGYSGESTASATGYSIQLNNNSYYTCEESDYYRPYEIYNHMPYLTRDMYCPNDTTKTYNPISKSIFNGILCCNLYVNWNRFFQYIYDEFNGTIVNNKKRVSKSAYIDELIRCTGETLCFYFSSASIKETEYNYFSNMINPSTQNKVTSLVDFMSVVNSFIAKDGNNNVIPVTGDTTISTFNNMTVDTFFNSIHQLIDDGIIDSNVSILTDYSLSTNWLQVLNLSNDTNVNNNSVSIFYALKTYVDNYNKCKDCNDCTQNNNNGDDIYDSDGSISGIDVKTKFAIICKFPYQYVNGNWTYKYSVRCYSKDKTISIKGYKISNGEEDASYTLFNNKFLITDYPFKDNSTCTGNGIRTNIVNGIFNTFNRASTDDEYYKFSAGTIYNLIEDVTIESWIENGVITDEYFTYNYLKSGNSIKECTGGSKPS